MSDFVCANCDHGPHRKGPCTACGCPTWVNAAVISARSLNTLTELAANLFPQMNAMLFDILNILAEVHPEAVDEVEAKRAELRQKMEEAKQSEPEKSE